MIAACPRADTAKGGEAFLVRHGKPYQQVRRLSASVHDGARLYRPVSELVREWCGDEAASQPGMLGEKNVATPK